MLTHVVLFRMAEGADPAELVERLMALPDQIPEIRHYEAGADVVAGATSFDVGLVSRFEDLDGLATYRDHPAHQAVVGWIGEHTIERAVVDYES